MTDAATTATPPPRSALDAPRSAHDPYAPLRIGAFRWYIVSLFAMTVAAQMQTVVVGWQMYAATKDPLALGLIGLTEAVPYISLALFAGHTADSHNRQRIAGSAIAVLVCCAGALLAVTLRAPHGVPTHVWPIFAIVFASGVARSFLQPARQAFSAELVPRELWPTAIAWRGSSWQLAAVVGPAVGGLTYGFAGPAVAYVGVVTLMSLALVGILAIRYTPRTLRTAEPRSLGESLTVALRFVRGQRILLGAITLDLFAVLFGGAVTLLPIFASEILRVGPQGLGLLQAAPAAGSVVMSVVVAHRPPMKHAGRALFVSVAIFGVCMIAFALSRSFLLSLALLTASGMADNVSVVIRSTLLQMLTPEELLGRVSSVNQIFIGSSNEIGGFESGVAARLLGTVPSVVVGGAMTLLVVATTMWRVPQLRRLRELR